MANKNSVGAAQVEEEKVPTAAEATEQTERTEGTEGTEASEKAPEIKEGADILTDFKFLRRTFLLREGEKDEKECFDYIVTFGFPTDDGVKEMKIRFIPSDVAGFAVLDLIFSFPNAHAEFVLRPWSIKADKKRGVEASSGYSYVVRCSELHDFELKVRPAQDSDKALAKAMLALAGYKAF